MKKLLTIALILCTLTSSAQMRGGSQFDPGAVRSNLTNITSGSALSVANGGTGKTTAAEGLAALGGASLNGSSTVDFNTKKIYGAASSNSAPTYSFSGDTDTGVYSTAPDVLGLGAGGVSGLVTSGGNTAMGASVSTSYKLKLYGSGANLAALKTELEPNAMTTTEARSVIGIQCEAVKHNISATATNTGYLRGLMVGSYIDDDNFQGGLANQYGAYVTTGILKGTGTITNSYGLYLGLLRTTGTIVNAWGLYQDAATARNYFAGRTLIGTNTDDGANKLQVNGNIKADKTLAADGTAAAPAYTFGSDTDTGMYRSSENTLALTASGVVGLYTSGGNTAMGAVVDTGTRLRIAGNNATHANAVLVEPPYRSLSVGSANYIDALKIAVQNDSIPAGETDPGYRQGIYINNSMYSTNFKGTLANLFGLRVDTGILNGTGTLTSCYGVYIKTASGTGIITNNWGLYQATAAARNYFAGRTLFGTTTDDGVSALQVAGGGLRLVGSTAPATPAEGTIYFNSTDKHFYGYNGTAWVQLDN